ncbi:phosphatidylserine decarboxylase [Mesobacillus campisalis]|uniref:Phosphatidylserine decarboxylase proenzyme n=1 Tax=Mesobacillus campisalis TaxID=1408103 RepID=A0A0M2SHL7_9BACI|nr:phosphatidylserine decarboxylase [Mesobacillus campisalis]KKK33121.1 phosphatidylserine decarboxylase [Mesobacillus campisalis]
MIQSLYRLMIELTNRRWSSTLLKRFARSSASKWVVPSFARTYKINQEEMEKELGEYKSLHDFFIRRLKPGTRITEAASDAIVSPVDAIIEDIGPVVPELEIHVKGKVYSIAEMLGSAEAASPYREGTYMVLYLSPTHYHRIHSPVSGTILNQWSLGSRSYPVNALGLKYGKGTLSKNYRMVTEIDYGSGRLALVKVGAMFVNSIETVHEGERLKKGEEMAYFSFGSTVVLLFEKDGIELAEDIVLPAHVKVGEKLGTLTPRH